MIIAFVFAIWIATPTLKLHVSINNSFQYENIIFDDEPVNILALTIKYVREFSRFYFVSIGVLQNH